MSREREGDKRTKGGGSWPEIRTGESLIYKRWKGNEQKCISIQSWQPGFQKYGQRN